MSSSSPVNNVPILLQTLRLPPLLYSQHPVNCHSRWLFFSSASLIQPFLFLFTLLFNWNHYSSENFLFGSSSCLKSEKAMASHSSTLAWRIPWTEEPGRLQSVGLRRVRHDWVTSLSLFTFMHWRRKWQPTPVLLPGESQGRGSLVGCRLWGRTELDMTEVT